MYNPLPHHLELVVYLTQMQDDHLNDPLIDSATCSKAKIGSKAEEASRPKKSCCCFTKFPESIFKSCFLSVATDEYQEEPGKMEFSWMKNSKSICNSILPRR